MATRLAVLASHPIQYQAPLYRALAGMPDIALRVFFCWDFGVKQTFDRGFGRRIEWDIPLLEGYEHEFLPNTSPKPGTSSPIGLLNLTAPARIRAFGPDALVVHGYTHATSMFALMAAGLDHIPVLLRGESHLLPKRSSSVLAAKAIGLGMFMKVLGGALAIGSLNRAYYLHYGLPEERIFHAPYSVDNAFFQERASKAKIDAAQWKLELGIPADHRVVLYAAKLIPVKGCADLIRAFHKASLPRTTLVIVGDGVLRSEFEQLAARKPENPVRFLGFVNQSKMPAAYALGDVFVLPSLYEPWGLAVNEAMNLGLPIIASNQVGASPDLVGSDNGWVFPAGDIEALARVLGNALSDDERLKARGRASLDRIGSWGIAETAAGYALAAHAVSKKKSPHASASGDRRAVL